MSNAELPAFVAELEALKDKVTKKNILFEMSDSGFTGTVVSQETEEEGIYGVNDEISHEIEMEWFGQASEPIELANVQMWCLLWNHAPALLALVRQLQGERDQLQSRIDQASADLSSVYADVERWVVSGTNEAEIPIERVHSAIHKAIFSLEKEGDRDV